MQKQGHRQKGHDSRAEIRSRTQASCESSVLHCAGLNGLEI